MDEQIESIYDIDKMQRTFKKQKQISIDVQGTKYDLIREVANNFQWNLLDQKRDEFKVCNIRWQDFYINEEELRRMLPFQKINHFPGSQSLGKKNNLGHSLLKMQKSFPNDFNFFPRTWLIPYQLEDLKTFFQNKEITNSQKILIVKPEAMCQGRGIFITKNIEQLNLQSHIIAQQYIQDPYLIDDLKFDCRLYVLIKNLNPLKIFLYKDGIARFATEPYKSPSSKNISNLFMHLTNYAIQKTSSQFQQNSLNNGVEAGHKRSFSSILKIIQSRGGDVKLLMTKIQEIVVKTVTSVQPTMMHSYKSSRPKDEQLELCFEILGFDIMIDQQINPWLIEVNHTPSFQTDSDLDYKIKKNLIMDTLILLDINNRDRKIYYELSKSMSTSALSKQIMSLNRQLEMVQEYENNNLNGFTRCFPTNNKQYNQQVESFIEGANQILNKWSGPKFKKEPFQGKHNEPQKPQKVKLKTTVNISSKESIEYDSKDLNKFTQYFTENYKKRFHGTQRQLFQNHLDYLQQTQQRQDENQFQQKKNILKQSQIKLACIQQQEIKLSSQQQQQIHLKYYQEKVEQECKLEPIFKQKQLQTSRKQLNKDISQQLNLQIILQQQNLFKQSLQELQLKFSRQNNLNKIQKFTPKKEVKKNLQNSSCSERQFQHFNSQFQVQGLKLQKDPLQLVIGKSIRNIRLATEE